MAGFEAFERDLRIATAGLEPAQANAALAKFARAELAKAIAAGASPQYERSVNGRIGAVEESVIAPGPIVYTFVNWLIAINTALAELRRRSPRRTGRYQNSFVVVVGGRTVVTDYSRIRPDAEVLIYNESPQTRKIETGYNGSGARHFVLAKDALNRRFSSVQSGMRVGAFEFEMKYVDVPGGISPRAPYLLKRTTKRRAAGTPLTYPALVINAL